MCETTIHFLIFFFDQGNNTNFLPAFQNVVKYKKWEMQIQCAAKPHTPLRVMGSDRLAVAPSACLPELGPLLEMAPRPV